MRSSLAPQVALGLSVSATTRNSDPPFVYVAFKCLACPEGLLHASGSCYTRERQLTSARKTMLKKDIALCPCGRKSAHRQLSLPRYAPLLSRGVCLPFGFPRTPLHSLAPLTWRTRQIPSVALPLLESSLACSKFSKGCISPAGTKQVHFAPARLRECNNLFDFRAAERITLLIDALGSITCLFCSTGVKDSVNWLEAVDSSRYVEYNVEL